MIKVPGEEACYQLYHSGVVDNSGRNGVAIALTEAAQAALLAWVPIVMSYRRGRHQKEVQEKARQDRKECVYYLHSVVN